MRAFLRQLWLYPRFRNLEYRFQASLRKSSSLEQFLRIRRYWLYGILFFNGTGWELVACRMVFSADGFRKREVPKEPSLFKKILRSKKTDFGVVAVHSKLEVILVVTNNDHK